MHKVGQCYVNGVDQRLGTSLPIRVFSGGRGNGGSPQTTLCSSIKALSPPKFPENNSENNSLLLNNSVLLTPQSISHGKPCRSTRITSLSKIVWPRLTSPRRSFQYKCVNIITDQYLVCPSLNSLFG